MQVNYTTEAFTSLSGLVNFIEANNTTNAGLRWLNQFEEFLQSTLKNPDKIKLCNNLTFSLLSLRCVYFRQLYTSWDRWEFNKIRYKYLLFINNLSICLSCPKLTNCMLPDRLAHYKEIEQSREGKLLVYITGDKPGMETQISNEVHDLFLNHLDKFNLPKKIILYLYTRGGDTMSAWGLINLLKQFCDEYEVIVPSKSRSAGTLICLGAERIIMTKQATLGPIDPSLNSSLNPQNPTFPQNPQARVPISVESIKGYFDYAKEELNIHDEENLSKIFLGLSNQIHPVVIGSVFRSRQQILMLATKLLKKHFGGDDEAMKKIINFLCSDSGSHDYPIFRREAREFGLPIEVPSPELYTVIKTIYDDIYRELGIPTPFDPNVILANSTQQTYSVRRSLIESIEGGTDVFVTEGELIKNQTQVQMGHNMPPIVQTTIQDTRKFEGWRHEN